MSKIDITFPPKQKGMQKSVFANIPIGVEDEPFQFTALYEADPSLEKVNLSIGAYRDGDGKPWVLPVVKKVYYTQTDSFFMFFKYLTSTETD